MVYKFVDSNLQRYVFFSTNALSKCAEIRFFSAKKIFLHFSAKKFGANNFLYINLFKISHEAFRHSPCDHKSHF